MKCVYSVMVTQQNDLTTHVSWTNLPHQLCHILVSAGDKLRNVNVNLSSPSFPSCSSNLDICGGVEEQSGNLSPLSQTFSAVPVLSPGSSMQQQTHGYTHTGSRHTAYLIILHVYIGPFKKNKKTILLSKAKICCHTVSTERCHTIPIV